jgi:hypothetical protein
MRLPTWKKKNFYWKAAKKITMQAKNASKIWRSFNREYTSKNKSSTEKMTKLLSLTIWSGPWKCANLNYTTLLLEKLKNGGWSFKVNLETKTDARIYFKDWIDLGQRFEKLNIINFKNDYAFKNGELNWKIKEMHSKIISMGNKLSSLMN